MKELTGTVKLLKLYIRRDWILLPLWVLLPAFLVITQISFVTAMPDWRLFIEELSESPLTSAWLGPVYPLNLEGAILWRGMLQAAIVIMFGAALTLVRHTRSEESSGRSELVLGKSVGRYANVTAAMILVFLGSILSGLLCTAFLISKGFAVDGSIIAGFTIGASGCVFSAMTTILVQIFDQSSKARGAIFGIYALTMIFMVLNNINGGYSHWAWLNPSAWFRVTAPFAENNIRPFGIFFILTLFFLYFSYILINKRDLYSGLITEKEISKHFDLKTPLGFAWHRHKKGILIWTAGLSFVGAFIGAITPKISMNAMGEVLAGLSGWGPAVMKLGNQKGFIALSIYMLGLMSGLSVFVLTFVQSMQREEKQGYLEMALSRPVSRLNWMGSYMLIAFGGSAIILLVLGIVSGLGWSIGSGEITNMYQAVIMSISKIPSVWVILGLSVFLYGWIPELSTFLGWLLWGVFVFVEMFWEAGIVNWSAMKFTPFAYAHYSIPIEELSIVSLLLLTGISIGFTFLGIVGFKRRSIN